MATKKSSVKRRARSVGSPQQAGRGMPGGEQDVKRRLGTFTGAGEHARQGGRHGIVGQTTKRVRTDKRSKTRPDKNTK
jgi:hypothetical protein